MYRKTAFSELLWLIRNNPSYSETQNQFAQRLNVSPREYIRLERGQVTPTFQTLYKIEEALPTWTIQLRQAHSHCVTQRRQEATR